MMRRKAALRNGLIGNTGVAVVGALVAARGSNPGLLVCGVLLAAYAAAELYSWMTLAKTSE